MANDRLLKLRKLMKENKMDAYYIPSSDFHDSEYVEDYFRCRAYMSGFKGSAGTMVVTDDFSGMWTDGRYFVQAKKELEDTELMRVGDEGVPSPEEFILEKLPENGVLGFDGRVVNAMLGCRFEEMMKKKNITLSIGKDLVGEFWEDRPALNAYDPIILDEKYCGRSAESKIAELREKMEKEGATAHIISSLDDIVWILNIRKLSKDGNLLIPAHILLTKDSLTLFTDSSRFSDEIRAYLEKLHVTLASYEGIYAAAAELRDETILLEPEKVNFALYRSIDASNKLIEKVNPSTFMKAMKNQVEMDNMRKVHIRDGVALTKFIYWIKQNAGKREISEVEAADYLESLRMQQPGYICPSFDTISAFGENAAMCHYHATKENCSPIEARSFYLVDSGGQYYDGTTDVTRTIVLGDISEEQKLHFTLVLMGHLRLANAKFLHGCHGYNLDYLARGPLWQQGLDFNHGTGHGVGYFACVHERPNGFRWKTVPERMDSAVLEEGMVTSDEPGLYLEGRYGIRHENLLLCKKAEKNEYGQFMEFETLTYAPFDLEAVDLSVMDASDIRLLNHYHKEVYEKISPYLTEEERIWLKDATREIGGDSCCQ